MGTWWRWQRLCLPSAEEQHRWAHHLSSTGTGCNDAGESAAVKGCVAVRQTPTLCRRRPHSSGWYCHARCARHMHALPTSAPIWMPAQIAPALPCRLFLQPLHDTGEQRCCQVTWVDTSRPPGLPAPCACTVCRCSCCARRPTPHSAWRCGARRRSLPPTPSRLL